MAIAGAGRQSSIHEPSGSRLERAVARVGSLFAARRQKRGSFVAQLVMQSEFRIEEEERQELGPDFLARAARLMVKGGWVEVEAGKSYVRKTPLIGLVKVGKRGYRTDEQGLVRLPSMPPVSELADVVVYQEDRAFVVLPKLELVPAGETPRPSMVIVPRAFPKER